MNFWDSSAVVPLLVNESRTPEILALYEHSAAVFVWMLTPLEVISALARLNRTGSLTTQALESACAHLKKLRGDLTFVRDVGTVASRAERIVRLHPLKAADALQLAAALIACQDNPSGHGFITLDQRLALCAGTEGFEVLPSQP